ncbi:YaaA family protein [Actinomyces gaoshouyii]|uniref:YaaA family protein n=1 Tax=Actinomyces gaoshouyii TaxID=1960083 RepID=UPI0009BCF0AD|nr:peroxide stress protein YaaA [Actinomyces gaoshouyii]ARD42724.1 hypothetical protein B6G06_03890 [Actinomyces gaoshouyii]
MLILLPPSEGKTPPVSGPRLDLASLLAADRLTTARREVMDELSRMSTAPDAAAILGLGPRSAADAALNLVLEEAPCAPAHELYTGVLYEAARLGGAGTPGEAEALSRHVVILSGLWGAVRATDRLPAHRLAMGASLPGCGRLNGFWKRELAAVLGPIAEEAGLVIDARSSAYAGAWQPARSWGGELLRIRAVRIRQGRRQVVSHHAKHMRGLLAGELIALRAAGRSPSTANGVAEAGAGLEGVADAELSAPDHSGRRDLTLVLA